MIRGDSVFGGVDGLGAVWGSLTSRKTYHSSSSHVFCAMDVTGFSLHFCERSQKGNIDWFIYIHIYIYAGVHTYGFGDIARATLAQPRLALHEVCNTSSSAGDILAEAKHIKQ